MERSFLVAFAVSFFLVVSPLAALTARLQAIGEIALTGDGEQVQALHGRLSKESDSHFKLGQVRLRRPRLLVLGSSRVLSLRHELFSPCSDRSCFYNAGGEKPTLRIGVDFYKASTAAAAPEVLLLGLDLWDFIPSYVPFDAPGKHNRRDLERGVYLRSRDSLGVVSFILETMRDDPRIRDIVLGRVPLRPDSVGIAPTLLGSGYRRDGSYEWGPLRYGEAIATPGPARVAPLVEDIRGAGRPFNAFDGPDQVTLGEVDELIALARSTGTRIVAYFPPLPAPAESALRANPKLAHGVEATLAAVRARFAGDGMAFVSVSADDAACSDDEYWDPLHPGEVCSARTMAALVKDPSARSILKDFVADETLRALLASARDPLVLVDTR